MTIENENEPLISDSKSYGSTSQESLTDHDLLNENKPINYKEDVKTEEFTVYWYRWYICLIFAVQGLLQGAVWNTWSPIDDSAEAAIGFTKSDTELLTNWGPISFIITMPFYMWLLQIKGLRLTVVSGAFLVAIATGLRCLPLPNHILQYVIHVAQFLNGIAGCPVMAVPPMLSNVWFPPAERITATGITTLFNYFGTGAAYIIGPLFVSEPPNSTLNISCFNVSKHSLPVNSSCFEIFKIRHEIQAVMYLEFGLAAANFIAMMIFFPKKPPTPPSVSASKARMSLMSGILSLRHHRQYLVVAFVTSIIFGTWGGWTGVMAIILKPLKVKQNESDFIGFMMTLIGCASGMFVGWFTDRLKGRMKTMLSILFIVSFLAFLYFVLLCLPSVNVDPFKPGKVEIWTTMIILGSQSMLLYHLVWS
nr:disrupted in renal carcinoma protein 2-like [Ciona intestinalis]|eukprot:XP_018673174.2 disrupted in renal carcinoma protein 2-like [Ciona intestinalis]